MARSRVETAVSRRSSSRRLDARQAFASTRRCWRFCSSTTQITVAQIRLYPPTDTEPRLPGKGTGAPAKKWAAAAPPTIALKMPGPVPRYRAQINTATTVKA